MIIGWLLVGLGWGLSVGDVWAAKVGSVSSERQSVVARDLEKAIFSALSRQYGRAQHRMSVRILIPKVPLSVPAGRRHLEVEQLTNGARTGRRAFRIKLFINGQFIKILNVVGEVKAQAIVAIPVRWIKPKEVIVAEDVASLKVALPSLTHDFVLDQANLIGKQVLRPLPPRKPIRKIMLDDPPLVNKGDRVVLEVRQGGLLVQTVGLAKAAGKSGETILVKNQNSGREVIGTVVGSGLVEVRF